MEYFLTKKRIKNIILRFDRYGNIKVSAPFWVKNNEINRFLDSKREWIESHQNLIKNNLPKYINGEKIMYFEDIYTLNLILSNRNKVEINNHILNIYARDLENPKKIEKMIFDFFIKRSNGYINEILSKYKNAINREVKYIKFRNMTSRWGSCSTRAATIRLNTLLFKKPKVCLEYVLLHELIHLIYANHGKDFYRLLESLMPNWREIKDILESKKTKESI